MKIIKRNSDNVVLYAGESIALDSDGATSQSGSRDTKATTANCTLVDGVSLPSPWTGGAYSHDGSFHVVNQALVDAVTPKTPVPQSVTMRQARLALRKAGLLASVDAAIAGLPSPQKEDAQIEWEFSSTVERNRPFVRLLGGALGLNSAQLDALFVAAAAE